MGTRLLISGGPLAKKENKWVKTAHDLQKLHMYKTRFKIGSWNEADPLTRCPEDWIFQFNKMTQAEYRQMIRGHKKTGRRRRQFNSWISNNSVIDQTEKWLPSVL